MPLAANGSQSLVSFCCCPCCRRLDGPFAFSLDHCFAIRGQGTVMTGTVLSGRVKVGEEVEDPVR